MVKEKQENESEIVNEADTTTVISVENEEKKSEMFMHLVVNVE